MHPQDKEIRPSRRKEFSAGADSRRTNTQERVAAPIVSRWGEAQERARDATPDPDLGPSHIYGDHSAGSYRRWLLGGGPEREAAYERAEEAKRRRALLQELWRRVHPEDPIPPDVLDLTDFSGER